MINYFGALQDRILLDMEIQMIIHIGTIHWKQALNKVLLIICKIMYKMATTTTQELCCLRWNQESFVYTFFANEWVIVMLFTLSKILNNWSLQVCIFIKLMNLNCF